MFWEIFGRRDLISLWHEYWGASEKPEEHSPKKINAKDRKVKTTSIKILLSMKKNGRLICKERERNTARHNL